MRGRALVPVAGAVTGALAAFLAVLVQQATGQGTWPGPLDWMRREPWYAIPVVAGLFLLVTWAVDQLQRPPVPRRVPAPPGWAVKRDETDGVVRALRPLKRRRLKAVGITTSLWGAGGFGRTLLAQLVARDRRVRRRFRRGGMEMVTIGRAVRGRADLAAKVAEVTERLTGDTRPFSDPDEAGVHLGSLPDSGPLRLLILDDVWDRDQLEPFLQGGARCVRLVTTRNSRLLDSSAPRVRGDGMSPVQARSVLTADLPDMPEAVVEDLLRATGGWALLLRLTNRLIVAQVTTGRDATEAARDMASRLRAHGPAVVDGLAPGSGFEVDDPKLRARAVKATVEASTGLLPRGGVERFRELAAFPDGEAIPVRHVARLWERTAGFDETATRLLCDPLSGLSLSQDPGSGASTSRDPETRDADSRLA
ncbi:NB-ARC domain-containing protein [Streptomyces sp. DSM 44917]|uniref:NB-ARC domain-containing protein n=1 Tax=Streptomyces boetiae TaxID=3075541 RepID=A0ABU2LG90_9ACTN|nr:NB-ARC domain-containing protein [Streptomyces sp. DSM 44917]MDT0310607.1 NB-ARC domain-containing protein [Streptomyces sp. DSM 44917]